MAPPICENDVVKLLVWIRRKMSTYDQDPEGAMNGRTKAHILVEAEKYYRTMMHAGPVSWNIRDRHMVSTLDRLMRFMALRQRNNMGTQFAYRRCQSNGDAGRGNG